ncbi:hypothetical protein IscW_ISCW017973 [Ixodes scapularis]|uniref:Uncharacterized protein n=1 Tax=Ixodes scapularis TaxID=6945 RepID=B7PIC1_IXOSC|nr:hypothetical protein IscW_ISCW017973 [Ixodes scapularis]|eukprot:XP_002404802.1 hypothetical protein IscW_ISCW017973 [Ixodes scapularis]
MTNCNLLCYAEDSCPRAYRIIIRKKHSLGFVIRCVSPTFFHVSQETHDLVQTQYAHYYNEYRKCKCTQADTRVARRKTSRLIEKSYPVMTKKSFLRMKNLSAHVVAQIATANSTRKQTSCSAA